MKSNIIIAIFLLNSLLLSSQTRYNIQRNIDGFNREFIVVVPSKAPPAGGYPLVMMLHGTSGDGEKFYNISGWKELGEVENFVTVFPSSLSWCYNENGIQKSNTRWVNGSLIEYPCSSQPQNYVDDVKFLKKVVEIIIDTLPINSKKIFASGFSNGSVMVHKLGIEAGGVFAAVAGGSGPLFMTDSATPSKRIPMWFILGNNDPNYLIPPITSLPFGGDSILTYLNSMLSRAIECQGLTHEFSNKNNALAHTYIFNQAQAGMSSKPYLFTLIKDMEHIYPNGLNFPFDAPKVFWEFFQQSTLVSNQSIATDHLKLEVFPNPSNSIIHIKLSHSDLKKSYNLKVFNALGELVYQQLNNSNSEIDLYKENLGIGLFLIKVESSNQFESKLISVY